MRQCVLMKVSCSTWVVHVRFNSYLYAHGSALEQVCLGIGLSHQFKTAAKGWCFAGKNGRSKPIPMENGISPSYRPCVLWTRRKGEDAYADNLPLGLAQNAFNDHSPSIHYIQARQRCHHGKPTTIHVERIWRRIQPLGVYVTSGQPNP